MIFMNDILTVIKMYDEEFTPFVISKIKENDQHEDQIERANQILLDSFRTTMRVYKPVIMQTFTNFILVSEFEKSHVH